MAPQYIQWTILTLLYQMLWKIPLVYKGLLEGLFCLFNLILYIPVNNFQLCLDGSSWVEPVLCKDKCVLLKTQHSDPREARTCGPLWPLNLQSSTLPLSHCAPWEGLFLNLSAVLCLGQEFWGTPVSPYLDFRGTFANSGGHTKFRLIFTCKIENSFPEISVHFYLHLSSMTIVLAQERVQNTVKLFLHCHSFESPSKYSISTLK